MVSASALKGPMQQGLASFNSQILVLWTSQDLLKLLISLATLRRLLPSAKPKSAKGKVPQPLLPLLFTAACFRHPKRRCDNFVQNKNDDRHSL